MKKTLTTTLLLALLWTTSSAQFPVVNILDVNQPEEPTIMMDYTNPARMMAATNITHVLHSVDTGKTWVRLLPNTSAYGLGGDPVLIADTTGSFYYFHLTNGLDRIACQRMDSLGGIWVNESYMGLNGNKDQDKEWGTVDRRNNNLYVTWTEFDLYGSQNSTDSSRIMFSRSTDRGQTWSNAIQINEISGNCIDSDETTEGAVPCVGTNGEIFVSWAGPAGIVFDRSLDQGNTWLNQDVFVDSMPGGWNYDVPGISRCNGLPVTKCDTSGGIYNGNIYINWTDQRNGENDTDVWLAKSTDGGNTWSTPKRVNNDLPGRHQFLTWMDLDQITGKIYVVFYDRRDTQNNYTDVYMAISEDGGDTFENIKVSESSFLPQSNVFFGDYTNIVAYNGIVRPIWARLDNTSLSVKTAIINYEVPNSITGMNKNENKLNVYPNPIKKQATAKFHNKSGGFISLIIYNMEGKKEATVIDNQYYGTGQHNIDFYHKTKYLPAGSYMLAFSVDEKIIDAQTIVIE